MSPQTLPAKTFILLCAVLVISTVAFFLLPVRGHHQDDLSLAAYYAGTDGLTGQELREKLHSTLEAGHTVVRYSGTTSGMNDVWAALMAANEDPDDSNSGLRSWGGANSIQLAEITLYGGNGSPLRDGITCTNPDGRNPGGELPEHACNGLTSDDPNGCSGCANTGHKWLDFNRGDLVLEFPAPQAVATWDW